MRADRLVRVELTVTDLDAAAAFYAALPGITVTGRGTADPALAALLGVERIDEIRLSRGAQTLVLQQLHPPGAPYPSGPVSCDRCFQHLAFPVADAVDAALTLPAQAAAVSVAGAQRLPPASGGATAYKFRDPDAHPLELIQFADGLSNTPAGIDHSAIVSADVERSIAFYRDVLGFGVAARQVNRGSAQDRLDGLTDTVVEVVALTPRQATPHVELLAYRTPPVRPGAPVAPNDVAATRLVIAVDAVPEPRTTLADGTLAALIRDPDGHYLLLVGT